MHFTLGAYFNCTSDNFTMEAYVLFGPWLDCFHQQTELGLWVVVYETLPEDKYLNETNSYIIPVWKLLTRRKAPTRSLCHRLGVTAGWSSDVRTILWVLQGHRAATLRAPYDYRKSLRSFLCHNDNLKPCVVLTITVRCPYGDRTMSLL